MSRRTPVDTLRLPILTFALGEQVFGLLIEDVVEVSAMVETLALPDAPPEVIGLVNRRGTVLPLIDLRRIFDQPAPPPTSASIFIVAAGGRQQVGLLVDEVFQVEYVDPLQFGDAPAAARFIHGIISHRSRLIPILALPPLLSVYAGSTAPG
jgi:purine-binding chemotaxis protein CheW